MLPSPGKGSSKFHNNPTFGRRDRSDSLDSFDLQFNNSFDAALDNLKIGNNTENLNRKSISDSKENFEMTSITGMESSRSNNQNKSMDRDNRPLIHNTEDHSTNNENPRKFQSVPRTGPINSFMSIFKNAFSNGSFGVGKNKSSISLNDDITEREIYPDTTPVYDKYKYPSNEVSNAKYNAVTFVPTLLYEQFKFFYNLYFLVVALSQAVPALRIGYLSSYIVPLAFVLTVTMLKEAMDDIRRRRRDRESNNELYQVLGKQILVPSKDLKVGDIIKLNKGDRVPADLILLQSSEPSGESFIKTDQLDGETDWKLRIACPLTQNVTEEDLQNKISLTASAPEKSINRFLGKLTYKGSSSSPLSVDNTLWANTVVASTGCCVACVIYTGRDTRQAMNTTSPTVKTGLLELEINSISKILCACVFILSIMLVVFAGFSNADWYVDIMRYLILFSTIIPVSLRVNLDLAKSVYAYQIEHDNTIQETIVRTSTIPEDLGRIEYLLSDKTGTLTQNDMQLRKIHLGSSAFSSESMDMVTDYVADLVGSNGKSFGNANSSKKSNEIGSRVRDLVVTLAICHNVTPTFEDDEITYQAASPDEIAIVKFTESVGLSLFKRDRHSITLLHTATGTTMSYQILQVFPFNSDTKRMGIIVYEEQTEEYWFFEKGADTVMAKIVESNVWLEEETGNMAREGLRTLVIGRKKLTKKVYEQFKADYSKASLSMLNRDTEMARIITKYLEHDLELQGLTGVEDKLQKDVKSSIELLRNAGIKIWMLTGDKVETARCVSISAKLIARGQYVHIITKLTKPEGALSQLEYLKVNKNACLLIDGDSLGMFLHYYRQEFFDVAIFLPTVIACRCTPQQKADVALIIRELTGKRVCCIGDGGNDVSMIQSADVGVGIVGKEGKQASLAADFSITQFCHLTELLLWHGRNSYKRSAKLAQFVMHRGLIIAVCQAVFSICSKFEPIALYQGWLMVGYATCYTMAPVFSLTLDHDIDESLTKMYPELYKDLTEGKSLSYKTFFVWCALSMYQGCVIQGFSQSFTGIEEIFFLKMVAISFTVLVFNELVMVALEINTWNKIMAITELLTFLLYVVSVPFLGEYFDLEYMKTLRFIGELLFILLISVFPVWAAKSIYRGLHPPSYAKVQEFSGV
ncbi:similar to Saccharomyces cerevisiae YIL048W NEO1 Putative aminophospholipid translocase (flippase) involved in endocytosis and vacuolar biogenesis [Maudiozyma barnettii]|uniref:Phospholipid-transporting ATPase n=1 Tax=Maudiozyma barnettii TaxID=61262 RepID=A0A8H2VBI7_9SACH|nr:putative aminophospholipid-translocating P4-type ATPase NEO1 [Kazachstania barnettii]CAB4252257.1 similar to Saccharomyces cerevisiae YIL048W NEO1 Putative aminophospholipid translocase (flippase) involved in endocytosis and vacuolar biogenesis [Kazachstania barnettii]CAD1778933.1 similar to Saccharomyces cerevisiae YIL048W NEO1 Putative aminophospholipid translocase (flippase) involved in endocytosis and vacuolar biogenesis [Kazachstania barnettii]